MQVGVIGGICLLTCLLSVGHSGELGDSKQSEESDSSDQKEVERSIENDGRRSSNEVKSSKEIVSDLKPDVNVTEDKLKSSAKIQDVSQNVAESPATNEISKNQSTSDPAVFINPPALPEVINPKSSSYFMDDFAVEQGIPVGQVPSTANNGPAINPYFSTVPFGHQGFVPGSPPPGLPPAPSNANVKNVGNIQDPLLRSQSPLSKNPIETKPSQELSTDNPQIDVTTSKSAERSIAINTNKVFNKLPTLYAKFAVETTTVQQGLRFSPLFSSEYSHRPSSEFIDPVYQASNNLKGYTPPMPQSYSYDSRVLFDETRREIKSDDIQERNADESQYSEAMNSYPYTPSEGAESSSEDLRSGAPSSSYPYQNSGTASAQAYASAQVQTPDELSAHNQGLNPYSYGYPRPSGSIASASASAQSSSSFTNALAGATDGAKSRVIWPHEYIFANKLSGVENVIQCSRENELHHLWSPTIDCLVCICLNEYGLLQPVCASCSGCRKPAPPEPPPNMPEPIPPMPTVEPYMPLPVPDPFVPLPIPNLQPFTPSASAPSLVAEPEFQLELTTPGTIPEVPVSCSPLPIGQLFKHPLNPCQLCMCKEISNALGKIEVRIDCQDSSQCIVPPETSTLPPMPEIPVPVPLPICDKFPPHVLFPHPKESCKQCKCSVSPSASGIMEQQITCFPNTSDSRCATKDEPTTEIASPTPPNPPIPIPVRPYPGPFPDQPVVEPVPEHFPPPQSPNDVTPKEPLPWPPISTTPSPPKPYIPIKRGPLPGPSPHESCQPYPPNHPFQHPWDDCQICECTEIKASGISNVEISCYTKLSCCIESPEHVISAIAGKSNPKASGGPNGEDGKAIAMVNDALSSTFRPPAYAAGFQPNQLPSYQSSNIISQGGGGQSSGETNYEYKPQGSFINQGISPGLGYADANTIAQNALNNPAYTIPGSLQFGNRPNAYGSVTSISATTGDVNAEYSIPSTGLNNPSQPFASGVSQNQAYLDASVVQKPLNPPVYQVPGYQPSVASSVSGGLSSETSEEYIPMTITYKPPIYPQYPGVPQIQPYADTGGQYNRPVSSTYKPPSLYGQYNAEVSPYQAYAEAIAQYNELMANTQKPPALYGQYTQGTQPVANAAYSAFVTSTFKPPALYNPYSPEALQNQAYAQYGNLVTSTPRPAGLYGQYGSEVSQNQVYPSPNAVYSATLTATDKPIAPYNPYATGIAQTQAYASANAQNSLTSPGYYLTAPMAQYPPGKATSTDSGVEQTPVVAEAVAQSQDYSAYGQSESQDGTSAVSNPSSVSSGYSYPPNYYTGYLSPQHFSSYQPRTNKGFEGYKQNQIQYAGNYDFNGQPDGISVLNPQSSYYPYGLGYSQGNPGTSMYSALYPQQNTYGISSLYRPGQYGASNAQSVAQAYSATKMQSKSGNPEDSEDSK